MECLVVNKEEQLAACLRIRTAVFVKEQGVPIEIEVDEYDHWPLPCRHVLVMEEDTPIATARWREYEPGVAKFQRIAVLREHRGRSVGRLLVRTMEEDAIRHGCSTSILDAQCDAEAFYSKLGYTTISAEPFYDADILHVRMTRSLA